MYDLSGWVARCKRTCLKHAVRTGKEKPKTRPARLASPITHKTATRDVQTGLDMNGIIVLRLNEIFFHRLRQFLLQKVHFVGKSDEKLTTIMPTSWGKFHNLLIGLHFSVTVMQIDSKSILFIQSSLLSKTHKTNIIQKLHKTKSTVAHSDRQAW